MTSNNALRTGFVAITVSVAALRGTAVTHADSTGAQTTQATQATTATPMPTPPATVTADNNPWD